MDSELFIENKTEHPQTTMKSCLFNAAKVVDSNEQKNHQSFHFVNEKGSKERILDFGVG